MRWMRWQLVPAGLCLPLIMILISCTEQPVAPMRQKIEPATGCTGFYVTLVPNEYFGQFWQNNGVGLWQSIDEVAGSSGDLDSYYIFKPFPSYEYRAHFGFTNISNPNPWAVIGDVKMRMWVEGAVNDWINIELWLAGNQVGSASVQLASSGIHAIEPHFTEIGPYSDINSLEIKIWTYSGTNPKVHAINAMIWAYVPGSPGCPDPTE